MKPGPIAYGALFCVAIPAALAAWAAFVDAGPHGVHALGTGLCLCALGAGLMAWAWAELWLRARALPMNAYPPRRRVESGPFAIMDHPMYTGFVIAIAGASLALGSGAGLALVTPVAALACAALVLGYERTATLARLGPRTRPAWLSIAPDIETPPTATQRFACWPMVFLPWLALYEGIGHLPAPDAVSSYLGAELEWPVRPWTEVVYLAVYPMTLLAPLGARSCRDLRRFEVSALVAMSAAFWCYLSLPFVAIPRPFDGGGLPGELLRLERADGLAGRVSFPSFHVYWALSAAWLWGRRGRAWAAAAWTLGVAICISCVTTGMHSVADLAAGLGLFAFSHHARRVWTFALTAAEHAANSWREWRIGPARVLIHAAYAGSAACAGMLIGGFLAGPDLLVWTAGIAAAGLVGAGLWGQVFEGSGRLARPFGYFGHIAGTAIALIAAGVVLGERAWILAAAFATLAPVVQAIGRVRCLVQGCCHGHPTQGLGIRHSHPLSRVTALAGWRGRVLHPTAVYSIVAGLAMFGLLARLWSVHASASFIAGAYLVLAGLCRFVEEHYRGEPQTPTVRGLHSYQWYAVAFVAGGAVLTCLEAPAAAWAGWQALPRTVPWAVSVGLLYAFAMGVDFPESGRRFARLAGQNPGDQKSGAPQEALLRLPRMPGPTTTTTTRDPLA